MKIIKYFLLAAAVTASIAYVDLKVNAMYSEPEILVFENLKLKFYETIKNVLK